MGSRWEVDGDDDGGGEGASSRSSCLFGFSFSFFSIQGFVFTNFTSTLTVSYFFSFFFLFLVGHADFDGLTSSFICSFSLPLCLLSSLRYVHNPGRLSFPPLLFHSVIDQHLYNCSIFFAPPLHVLVDIVLVLPHIRTPVYCTLYWLNHNPPLIC